MKLKEEKAAEEKRMEDEFKKKLMMEPKCLPSRMTEYRFSYFRLALFLITFQLKIEKRGKIVNDLVDIDFEQTVMK